MPRLECRNLVKRLPSGGRMLTILDGIDLVVPAGDFVAILGPSGSGKSTLLGLMAGLDRPTEGSVRIDDQALEDLDEDALALLRRGRVGFVFQNFQLLANLTALENVLLPLELTGTTNARPRATGLLDRVGLGGRIHHYPSQLSGGEQQRVALARAFAGGPDILLADEPTGNLDSATGKEALDLLLELRAREGATLVLVTHDPQVAARAHRRVHLDAGRIVREENDRVKAGVYLRWMVRESRGSRGRMLYFAACLAVGVAAVVGTAALAASVENSYRSRSREILGADFTVDARRPLPPELDAALAALPGAERTDTLETATMVAAKAGSELALLHAIRGRYPLYGAIVTEPPGGLERWLEDDTVVAAADLLTKLKLQPNDTLRVGGVDFRIAAAVKKEPGTFGFASFLGPRVYLTRAGFDRTDLLGFGSRVRYKAQVALPGTPSREELETIVEDLEAGLPGAAYLDFDSHYDAGPSGRRSVQRIEAFVGLVALLSLVVGGIGVSQIVRAWLAGRTQAIAVMRCLGLRPAQILVLSLGHTTLLALAGSVVGAALGCGVPFLARAVGPELFAGDATIVVPFAAVARGLGLGVGLALAFCLPPLTAIWRVAPARVLRADADPLPPNRLVTMAAAAAVLLGVFVAAWIQAGAVLPAAVFTGGFVVLGAALYLGARLLMGLAKRVPRRRLHPYLVHGVSALARPGAGTTGAVVALGLGTMVVTAMWLVETRLREGILGQIPADAPSVFLVDIQPDQWAGVQKELEDAGGTAIDQVPVVMARISRIDGRPVEELAAEAGDEGWSRRSLTREQRLTWRADLTDDNKLVEGELWADPDRAELSIEERFAGRLGVELGSVIEFDVQGVPVTYHVTSLRSVKWQSLSINFFFVVEPGTLQGAPALYLANAHVPPAAEQPLQDAVTELWPNVTVLRVRPILEQVLALLQRIAAGIRLLGSFTVLAGLAILAGAVSATALRRGGEVALLKTLGITRAGVTALFLTEYGLCGAVAGLVGAGGAFLLAWGYLEYVAELDVSLPLLALPVATVGCAVLTALCGVAASFRSLTVRPIEALR